MLVRLLYASRAIDSSESVIEAIYAHAKEANIANGITGILCHGNGVFIQAIEGGRRQVSDLYAVILKDPRHHHIELLHFEEISERRFGSWTLGQVNMSRLNQSILLKYSATSELDPYSVSGKVSLALLEELAATASIVGRN